MSLPVEGSESSKKTHLTKVWEQTGKKPKELADQPEMPEGIEYVWVWFLELLQGGTFSWTEIRAWSDMRGIKPQAEELELLLGLNQLYNSIHHGRRRNKTSS